ncbi:MAG TPA: hypothetical protein P5228_11955 [Bacteroidales bacterium]|nr:hypothetical protein [Bacteroidales bacterium]HRZ48111.1 hypothetical protein [Bacteroidales bacterium]
MEKNPSKASLNQEKPRPVFLTVLCILSYAGNGFVILGSLITLVMAGPFRMIWEKAMEQPEMYEEVPVPFTDMFDRFASLFDYLPLISWVNLAAALLNLFGVYQMWKMKKSGYYVYSVTELAPYILAVIVYTMALGPFGFAMSLFNMVIPVAFVILYGLNLKHMD